MTLENFGHFLRALAYNGGFTLVSALKVGMTEQDRGP